MSEACELSLSVMVEMMCQLCGRLTLQLPCMVLVAFEFGPIRATFLLVLSGRVPACHVLCNHDNQTNSSQPCSQAPAQLWLFRSGNNEGWQCFTGHFATSIGLVGRSSSLTEVWLIQISPYMLDHAHFRIFLLISIVEQCSAAKQGQINQHTSWKNTAIHNTQFFKMLQGNLWVSQA